MTTSNFKTLKQLLISEENFSDVFDYFFKHFGENQNFYELGELSSNEMLFTVLKATGKNFYGEKCKIANARLTEISEQNFIHGTCFLEENLVLVIYFTDLNLGLASISMGGAMFNFVRLKASHLSEGYGVQFSNKEGKVLN